MIGLGETGDGQKVIVGTDDPPHFSVVAIAPCSHVTASQRCATCEARAEQRLTSDRFETAVVRSGGPVRIGKRKRIGYAIMPCPENCGGEVSTERASMQFEIPKGLCWLGCPCSLCDKTFTIEVTEVPDA